MRDLAMHTTLRLPAALVLAIATVVVGAGSAVASASIPFAALFSGSAAFTSPTTTAFSGSGIATEMGAIVDAGTVQITGSDDPSCAGGIPNVHVEVLTAANGDRLRISSNDVACPVGPGQYHGTGTWVVIGGTGRFTSATGSGTFRGVSDFVAGTFSITLTGTIALAQ